jgi:hypothetical protein
LITLAEWLDRYHENSQVVINGEATLNDLGIFKTHIPGVFVNRTASARSCIITGTSATHITIPLVIDYDWYDHSRDSLMTIRLGPNVLLKYIGVIYPNLEGEPLNMPILLAVKSESWWTKTVMNVTPTREMVDFCTNTFSITV